MSKFAALLPVMVKVARWLENAQAAKYETNLLNILSPWRFSCHQTPSGLFREKDSDMLLD
jgi:hypothetical protein